MPYKQAAEQQQELPSRSIPRRRRPEFVPAGRVHAIDTDTREVACGINAAGLYVFDRERASGIGHGPVPSLRRGDRLWKAARCMSTRHLAARRHERPRADP
jgi:hypothetical protein